MLHMHRESVRRILTEELNMRKVCAKMVPKVLSDEQKERRTELCCDLLERIDGEPSFLKSVITADETWIFTYDPEPKRQSMHWKTPSSPRAKKAHMRHSKFKAMLIVFFYIQGIIMAEWVPSGQTVNQQYYKQFWKNCVNVLERSALNCGRMGGSCTRTMRLPTTVSYTHLDVYKRQHEYY